MTFDDLPIGSEFDFRDPAAAFSPSFTKRCTKVSARCYTYVSGAHEYESQVGSVHVPVFNVGVNTCTYPLCKCIVSTSTSQPEPICPKGLER